MNVPDYLKRIYVSFNRSLRLLILSKWKTILTNRKAAHIFTHLDVVNRHRRLIVE